MVRIDRVVEVRVAPDSGEVNVCCDGVLIGELRHRDRLIIQRAATHVRLLHSPDYDYYRLLRSKLHWGRGELPGLDHPGKPLAAELRHATAL
jgi:NAD+ kinase